MIQTLCTTLTIAVALYICILLVAWLAQDRLVYSPRRDLVATPGAKGLEFESVEFSTLDGLVLHGWFVPGNPEPGCILFCHGNGGNISHRIESLQIFHELGFSTFIFDYRGYGLSEGRPSEEGTHLDAVGAWSYLVEERGLEASDIALFGRSLGGSVAARLALTHHPRALIVESSFLSIPSLGAERYPILPVRILSRFAYDTGSYIQSVECPVLIIHSPDDDTVPFSHGRELFRVAREPKQFLKIHGDHDSGFLMDRIHYVAGLRSFLHSHGGLASEMTSRSVPDDGVPFEPVRGTSLTGDGATSPGTRQCGLPTIHTTAGNARG